MVTAMRAIKLLDWPHRHYARGVNHLMAGIIMIFDMVKEDRLSDSIHLINLFHVTIEIWVIINAA